MENTKKRRCYNCKFKSESFKISKLTHYHCLNEEQYPPKDMKNGVITPWDTLRVFSESCDEHKFKDESEHLL